MAPNAPKAVWGLSFFIANQLGKNHHSLRAGLTTQVAICEELEGSPGHQISDRIGFAGCIGPTWNGPFSTLGDGDFCYSQSNAGYKLNLSRRPSRRNLPISIVGSVSWLPAAIGPTLIYL